MSSFIRIRKMVQALKQTTAALPPLANRGILQLHDYPPLQKDSVTCIPYLVLQSLLLRIWSLKMLAVCALTSAVSFLHALDETTADVRQHHQPIESSDMESNPLPSFCQHVNHNTSNFKYSAILSVLDPRKCEYLKNYSIDFEHAYMTTYPASWEACWY